MKIRIEPVVDSLSRGPVLSRVLTVLFRVLAGVAVFLGLIISLAILGAVVNSLGNDAVQALGMLIALAVAVAYFFLAVKVLLYRAKCFPAHSGDVYPVISLSALVLKAAGELSALFASAWGLFAGISIWFAGDFLPAIAFLDFIEAIEISFFSGLLAVLAGQIYAVAALLFSYLLSELLRLLTDIAAKK